MSLLRVLIYGDERLRKVSEPVERMTPELSRLIADTAETMYKAAGVGLAAPQVGVLRRFLVLDVDQVGEGRKKERRRRLQVFINPRITWLSDEDSPYAEGCLSIPGVEEEIYRPSRIRLAYRDPDWNEREEEVEGLLARVLQHEIDHLDGVLFVDRLGFAKRQALAGKLRRLRTEHDSIFVPSEVNAM